MGLPIAMIHLILLTYVQTSQANESIGCNNVKTGNLRSNNNETAKFSFTITQDINQAWFSTCGSQMDLHELGIQQRIANISQYPRDTI